MFPQDGDGREGAPGFQAMLSGSEIEQQPACTRTDIVWKHTTRQSVHDELDLLLYKCCCSSDVLGPVAMPISSISVSHVSPCWRNAPQL